MVLVEQPQAVGRRSPVTRSRTRNAMSPRGPRPSPPIRKRSFTAPAHARDCLRSERRHLRARARSRRWRVHASGSSMDGIASCTAHAAPNVGDTPGPTKLAPAARRFGTRRRRADPSVPTTVSYRSARPSDRVATKGCTHDAIASGAALRRSTRTWGSSRSPRTVGHPARRTLATPVRVHLAMAH